VRKTIADLYDRVGDVIPKTQQPDHLTAMNYLKGLAGFSRMLESPNYSEVLAELEKLDSTTVGNLLAFMHTYNLRFGVAETPEQRQAYRSLYPALAATREKVLGAGPLPKEAEPIKPSTDIFNGMDAKILHAPSARPTPAPPAPRPTKP
jgi:hypothetical protein